MRYILQIALFVASLQLVSCGDNCRRTKCQNNSYCFEGECICPRWYSGETCDLAYNKQFEGLYKGTQTEAGRTLADTLRLEADDVFPNRMNLMSGMYFDFETDSTLIIPYQELKTDFGLVKVEGKGIYSESSISFEYGLPEVSINDSVVPASIVGNFAGSRAEEVQ